MLIQGRDEKRRMDNLEDQDMTYSDYEEVTGTYEAYEDGLTYEDGLSYTDYCTEVRGRFPHFNLSVALAKRLGKHGTPNYTASAILVYFRGLQRFATMERDSKLWFFCPLVRHDCAKASSTHYRPISDTICWLRSASSVCENIQVLVDAGMLLKDEFNKMRSDRTCWYHVPDEVCKELDAEKYRAYFFPDEAKKYGIHAALVNSSLYFDFDWYKANAEKENFTGYAKFNKTAIASRLAMRECTVRSCFKKLCTEKGLHQHELGYKLLAPNCVTFNGVQTYKRRQIVRPVDAPMGQVTATDVQEAGAMAVLRKVKADAPAVKSAFLQAAPANFKAAPDASTVAPKLKVRKRRTGKKKAHGRIPRFEGMPTTSVREVIAKCQCQAEAALSA